MVTISVHNGSSVCRAHNLRLPGVTKTRFHIDPNGIHEVWHDEAEAAAYRRLFQDAVDEYNSKQVRDDRIIRNFHSKIAQSGQQSTAYEVIVGVYGSDCNPQTGYKILRAYYENWKARNPRLEVIGVYYHADEDGDPHIHLDYIPVANGYTKGVSKQPGMRRALEQMGYGKNGKETAQIAWERSEQEYLERLCTAHGLVVDHPGGRKKHLSVNEYKEAKETERLEKAEAAMIELHEKKVLGSGRVTVDREGLQALKDQARAYRIKNSEPSLRTRSALAAQRQSSLLERESALLEREKALKEEKQFIEQERQKQAMEFEKQRVNMNAMMDILDWVEKVLIEILEKMAMPQAVSSILGKIVKRIDNTIGKLEDHSDNCEH